MMEIRPLTIEELPLCEPFGKAFHAEKDIYGQFSGELFVKNWTIFLTRCHGVIFGLWVDGILGGGIGGMVAPDLSAIDPVTWTPIIVATEFFLYIDPDYRKGDRWLRLIEQFRAFGKSKGATRFRIGAPILKGEEMDRAAKALAHHYNKMGMRAIDLGFEGPI